MFIVRAAVLERCLSLFGGPETYVLCDDLVELSKRLDREASVNRWLLLAGLVLSVAAPALSRVRRGRVLPVLMLCSVLGLAVLADDHAARADAVALRISTSQTCDEPKNLKTEPRRVARGVSRRSRFAKPGIWR
ncbi:hypothetical protein ACF073_23065 [Streptomyces sp. NPDC015171]|uniref:hypothetical protein n=1 Tax=Streptomyces sp. NPDC015171 TaxID=3364945 RepID=UPI003700D78A